MDAAPRAAYNALAAVDDFVAWVPRPGEFWRVIGSVDGHRTESFAGVSSRDEIPASLAAAQAAAPDLTDWHVEHYVPLTLVFREDAPAPAQAG